MPEEEKVPSKDIFSYLEGKKEEKPKEDGATRKNMGVSDLAKGGTSPEVLSKAEGAKEKKLPEEPLNQKPSATVQDKEKGGRGVIPKEQLKTLEGKKQIARAPEGHAESLGKKAGESLIKGDKEERKSGEGQELERLRKMGVSPEKLKETQLALRENASGRGKMTSKNGKRIPQAQNEKAKKTETRSKEGKKREGGAKEIAKRKVKEEVKKQVKEGIERKIVSGLFGLQNPLFTIKAVQGVYKKLFRRS